MRTLPLPLLSRFFSLAAVFLACLPLPGQPGDFSGGWGPPSMPGGGGGGMGGPETKLLTRFDKDGDKRLNAAERKAAREYLSQYSNRGGRGGSFGGGPFGGGQQSATPQAGVNLTPADVRSYGSEPLYDPLTLRTLFLDFEETDWEKELAAFYNSDVDVAAKARVDGKSYADVGVHFRGNTSYMMVSEGYKRSFGISFDFADEKQSLGGYRTLDILNSHEDATFLRTVLFNRISGEYIPAPKANFIRVVINGENWGVYVNAQHFNKDFTKEWFGTTAGARWKVPGSPNGRGGLAYLGDNASAYKNVYEIKSKDDAKSWAALATLCKVLDQTPADRLETALAPLLDIDGVLKYLALDNVFVNNDGFWTRASDYNLYLDDKGRFHMITHDTNETFARADQGGPGGGFGGGPFGGGGSSQLDPLVLANDTSKPIASKLLAVPALRTRYLGYVRDIAEKWLDWSRLGPIAQEYQSLIDADVARDTRKLDSYEEFKSGLTNSSTGNQQRFRGGPGGGSIDLKTFAEQRRAYLLSYPAIETLPAR